MHRQVLNTCAISLVFCFLGLTRPALGEIDLALQGGARSFPMGGSVVAKGGISQLLWGIKQPGSILFGYLREQVSLSSSFLFNQAESSLEFYPVSILGVSWGRSFSRASVNSKEYSCGESITCMGTTQRDSIKYRLILGWQNLFGILEHQNGKFKSLSNQTEERFMDLQLALQALFPEDLYRRETAVLGLNQTDWLLLAVHDQAQNSFSSSHFSYSGLGFVDQRKPFHWGLMLGVFRSNDLHDDWSVVATASWTVLPGLPLF